MSTSADWTQPGYNPSEHGWWKADTGESNYGYPQDYFYADSIRAVNVAFGNKFSNIWIVRKDEKGYPRKRIQVPIKFGPRAKSHDYRTEVETSNIDENGIVDPKYYIQNPNIAWKYTGGQYDGSRQTSSDQVRTFYNNYLLSKGVELSMCNLLWEDTMCIPVNMNIEMTAYADKDDDLLQIFEQVIGKTKDSAAFLYVKEFWFMNIRRDIKIKLEQFNFNWGEDNMGEEAKRECSVTFNFTCEANVYRPIKKSSIITSIVTTLYPRVVDSSVVRFGLSGNMYMDEKYKDPATYAAAASSRTFDGSLTSAYDFTNQGTVAVALASAVCDTQIIPFTEQDKLEASAAYSAVASNIDGYMLKYVYSAIPESWREYSRSDRLLDFTTYIFGDTNDGCDIIDGEAVTGLPVSGVCLYNYNSYIYPYSTMQDCKRANREYSVKPLEDAKNNIINAIYGASHGNYLLTKTSASDLGVETPMVAGVPLEDAIYITPITSSINTVDLYQQWTYIAKLDEWRQLGTISLGYMQ